MTTWKPGDVAVAYDRDWEFRVVRHLGEPAYWSAADGEWPAVSADSLDYRPLVVVDPESADDIDRLCDLIAEDVDWLALQAALREFANPTPPKPAEPQGLGAVVETESGRRYVRTYGEADQSDYECWKADILTSRCRWSEIPQPVRVLSEGVTP